MKTLQMDMQELTDSLLKAVSHQSILICKLSFFFVYILQFHAKVADYSASIKELGMDVFSSQQLAS